MAQVTEEQLCAALISNGTVKKAAEVLNVSERTVYNMMKTGSFKSIYQYAQADILNATLGVCQEKMTEAVNCIADIMNDRETAAGTRLEAARTMLSLSMRMYDKVDHIRNMAAVEEEFDF